MVDRRRFEDAIEWRERLNYVDDLSRLRNRWRNLAPPLLYPSDPAWRKASQIWATLRPSVAAMVSRVFLSS